MSESFELDPAKIRYVTVDHLEAYANRKVLGFIYPGWDASELPPICTKASPLPMLGMGEWGFLSAYLAGKFGFRTGETRGRLRVVKSVWIGRIIKDILVIAARVGSVLFSDWIKVERFYTGALVQYRGRIFWIGHHLDNPITNPCSNMPSKYSPSLEEYEIFLEPDKIRARAERLYSDFLSKNKIQVETYPIGR